MHGMKFHAAIVPCGLAAHGFGPINGCCHDTTMLCYLGLRHALPNMVYNGVVYYMYRDKGHRMAPNFLVEIYKPAAGSPEARLNSAMAKVRTCTSECNYQIVNNFFQNL